MHVQITEPWALSELSVSTFQCLGKSDHPDQQLGGVDIHISGTSRAYGCTGVRHRTNLPREPARTCIYRPQREHINMFMF